MPPSLDAPSNTDVADRLTKATRSTFASQTFYDLAGRQIQSIDPDLGTWYYTYNALNLTRQTDARGQRVCFYYDALNRLTGKHYRSDDSCPSSYTTPGVSYAYDAGTNGKGQRTSMTDASDSASWTYDARGRMATETKNVTGVGSFLTQWGYNSADNVTWMKYPGGSGGQAGEQVYFNYLPQNLINTVIGSTTYIKGSTYDAAGRLDLRELGLSGSNPVLKTDYTYFSWTTANGQGRLMSLTSGTPSSPTSLQDLRYYSGSNPVVPSYDAVGNLLNIYDYKAGSPQTQTFTYDAADRLHTAIASGTLGVDGAYNQEIYDYDDQGRLMGLPTMGTYDYSGAHPHAVEKINGSQKYWYDANGNMSQRVVGANTFNLTYDAENHQTGVSGSTTQFPLPPFRSNHEREGGVDSAN